MKATKSKRGRKPKQEYQLLRNEVKLHLDDGDFAVLMSKVQRSGLSRNQYCTEVLRGSTVKAALTDEEKHQVRVLQGIANNLNQLTREAHAFGMPKVVGKIERLMDETVTLLAKFSRG